MFDPMIRSGPYLFSCSFIHVNQPVETSLRITYPFQIAVHSPFEVPAFEDNRFSVKKADETIGIYKIVEVVYVPNTITTTNGSC